MFITPFVHFVHLVLYNDSTAIFGNFVTIYGYYLLNLYIIM